MADEKRKWDEIAAKGKVSDVREKIGSKAPDPAMEKVRSEIISGYMKDTAECLDKVLDTSSDKISEITQHIFEAYKQNKQIILMGNGGSSSIASHIAADFSKGWLGDEHGIMRLRSLSLVDNVSLLTSWMNDAGQDQMFVGQLKTVMNPGDIVIGISGSGNSKNIINAIEYANSAGAKTIGLCGFDGGKLKDAATISLVVPSDSFKRIEDIHMMIGHLLKAVLMREIKEALK
jgi:D-sedoheptulose 7-phosphate isomerase